MKKTFYLGFFGLLLFEIMNVYLIMPMPGSQRMNSIDIAYFLYKWRWVFRTIFGLLLLIGLFKTNWKRKWTVAIPLVILGVVIYMTNFNMAADHMFYKPENIVMSNAGTNKVDTGRLVLGVVNNGLSKAYPIRFLGYHHQLIDTVGGKPLLVTYCTVCRTGRVYEPIVNGKQETFRLVGMDHFNAMLEDVTTKSWWRQATGEAITGTLKGQRLPEFHSTQTSLAEWLELNPNSLVMQEDPSYKNEYDTSLNYESGKSRKLLTGTDSLSWKDKSWVLGVKYGNEAKAYDWIDLKSKRVINDQLNGKSIVVVLAKDDKSFFAFENPTGANFSLNNDTLLLNDQKFLVNGKAVNGSNSLMPLQAYQEFWHSWRTFQPATLQYKQ